MLLLTFAAAALAGSVLEPSSPGAGAERGTAATEEHGTGRAAATPQALPGLAVAEAGHRLVLDPVRPGRAAAVRFRIVDAAGAAVRDFELEHERRLHLIVVRRDLATFEHLHPRMGRDGTWSARADLSRPGTYRVLADFRRRGTKLTLGSDVQIPGAFAPRPLPAPATDARTEAGLEAALAGRPRTGRPTLLTFAVRDRGRDVTRELDPYLGAAGHLVALREGDLAYLHTHPGEGLDFETTFPSRGTYRLFLQVRRDGRVQTAPFTVRLG